VSISESEMKELTCNNEQQAFQPEQNVNKTPQA